MPLRTVLTIPSPSLVVMMGAAGSGKSTFCRRNFLPGQIVSTDACREMLAGDPADQSVSAGAFGLAHRIAESRLRRKRLTVFDATCVDARARRPLLELAARHDLPAVAIVLDPPTEECFAGDRSRSRRVGRAIIERQARRLRASLPGLRSEGFALVRVIRSALEIRRIRVATDSPFRHPSRIPNGSLDDDGPFDIIGDVHGCADELVRLLERLGYRRPSPRRAFRHPAGRRAIFVGDLVDRGPRVVQAARIAMRMVAEGSARCVPGNHELEFLQCLQDGAGAPGAGTLLSIRQIGSLHPEARRRFIEQFRAFVSRLPAHLVLDRGRLAVAHAGIKDEYIGRRSRAARLFAIHGQTTGGRDRYGLPVRVNWAADYAGQALVVYGHTPVPEPEWIRNTVNIDTGCVYGGKLSALRYPELTVVSVKARRAYYRPRRSLPAGVGLRAETRAQPVARALSAPRPRPAGAPRPPRSPAGPPRSAPSPPSSPPAGLAGRRAPSRGSAPGAEIPL